MKRSIRLVVRPRDRLPSAEGGLRRGPCLERSAFSGRKLTMILVEPREHSWGELAGKRRHRRAAATTTDSVGRNSRIWVRRVGRHDTAPPLAFGLRIRVPVTLHAREVVGSIFDDLRRAQPKMPL
jgi:hypothetical protein